MTRPRLSPTLSTLALVTSLTMFPGCASVGAPTGATSGAPHAAGHRWDALRESSPPNVRVHWPDGHTTGGLDEPRGELARLLDSASDVRVESEPTHAAHGDWTTVVRVLSGNIRQPRRPFRIWVATISHSTNGVVDDLYLFWSDRSVKDQLGI